MRYLLLCITLALLAACGFTPVYAPAENGVAVQNVLNQIEISNIPDQSGQFLKNRLIDRFYKKGRPLDADYFLEVTPVIETITDLDITETSDATRAQLRLLTTIRLYEKGSGKASLERDLRSVTSYNILPSQFTVRVSLKDARENALEDLARQIEQQLALYFKSRL